MSPTLAEDLEIERHAGTTPTHTSTGRLRLLPDLPTEPVDNRGGVIGQARRRADRTIPSAVIAAAQEAGQMKNPGPSQVRGSNEILLVAGTGFEPVPGVESVTGKTPCQWHLTRGDTELCPCGEVDKCGQSCNLGLHEDDTLAGVAAWLHGLG